MNSPGSGYRLFAAGVALFLGWALWRGWSPLRADKVDKVPKSVRDNPGAYRSHYRSYGRRYYGGK